jgi:hypothetical protein
MEMVTEQSRLEAPEKIVSHLVARLRNHALWDSLLIFSSPLLVCLYLAGYLFRAAWINPLTFFLVVLVLLGIGLLAILVRLRPLIPSAPAAARLVDGQAGANDRFLTLATIDPSQWSASLVARLRLEAAGFSGRIELKRDFPYQTKKTFYWSLIGSVVAAVLFHLLLPVAVSTLYPVAVPQQLRELADKMAQRPRLSEVARGLQTLATKLEDAKVSQQEKQALVQEMQKQVKEQQKKEEQKDNRDLLGQAASTLQGLEQQSGNGQDQKKDQDGGAGGIQSNLPQEGQGEGKPSPGSGGDRKGDLNAQLNKEMQQGKAAQGDPKEQGKEKNQQSQGDGKGKEPDPNKPGSDRSKETAGKNPGGTEEKSGRSKTSEDIPQGAPPAERFYQGAEQGREGIKGARYVTVQLPEEMAADSKGGKGGTKESKANRIGAKVPVSNVPLPAHVPDAPAEKQQMPLEYRGILR